MRAVRQSSLGILQPGQLRHDLILRGLDVIAFEARLALSIIFLVFW